MECDWTFSWFPLHVHFKWGVALVGEFFYWALLIPLWDPLSGTGGCTRRQLSDETVIMKKVDVWP